MISDERITFNEQYIQKMVNRVSTRINTINIEEPQTIQEKLMWLNIYDADTLKSDCADKIKVKQYAIDKLGEDISVPTISVYNNTEEIDFSILPEKFVIKCNHGSGMNLIIKNKQEMNKSDILSKLGIWMNRDFTFQNGFESHYHWIERKIFAEELLGNGTSDLKDYKFWCFNGEPKLWTINDGFGHGDIMYYNMDGSEWNLYGIPESSIQKYTKPHTFDKMVDYAIKLSKPFKFVRVDFYEFDERPYLGELTFTPGAFLFRYKTHEDEIKVGSFLKL